MDETGDRSAQVEQRVHFDRRFCRTEIRPGKQRQTQIDGCAVERINRVGEIKANIVFDIKFACALDQNGGQIRPHTPIAQLVGVSQSRLCDGLAQSHAVQFCGLSAETGLDVAQALAIGDLRKSHNAEMFRAPKRSDADVAAILPDNAIKTRPWNEIHDLRKEGLA
jgi:hypothetical protein